MNGLGQFNMQQGKLKELSDAELAMHIEYMVERFKQLNKMKFDCKLSLDAECYEILNIPSKTQKEFKIRFRQVMENKILEAKTEFLSRDGSLFTSNVREVLGR